MSESKLSKPKLRYSCKFPGCNNKQYTADHSLAYLNKRFRRFPRSNDIRKKWIAVCIIDHSVNCDHFYVCDDHFFDEDFFNQTKHRLNWNSVPKPSQTSANLASKKTQFSLAKAESSSTAGHTELSASRDERSETEITQDLRETLNINSFGIASSCANNIESRTSVSKESNGNNDNLNLPKLSNQEPFEDNINDYEKNSSNNELDYPDDGLPISTSLLLEVGEMLKTTSHRQINEDELLEDDVISDLEDAKLLLPAKRKSTDAEILGRIGLKKKDLTPRKSEMYKIFRNVNSKFSKLKNKLQKKR